jgi:hypothetical protein
MRWMTWRATSARHYREVFYASVPEVETGRCCPPRHRHAFRTQVSGMKCHSMPSRAISARPIARHVIDTHIVNPRFLSHMASCDVASIICQAQARYCQPCHRQRVVKFRFLS